MQDGTVRLWEFENGHCESIVDVYRDSNCKNMKINSDEYDDQSRISYKNKEEFIPVTNISLIRLDNESSLLAVSLFR